MAAPFSDPSAPIQTAHAPAKLNLSLAVLACRPDGFHEIESLMVPVTLYDTLHVRATPTPAIQLSVRFAGRLGQPVAAALRRDVPADATNLVVRAARLLAEEAGVRQGLAIELVKEIPSGAGLGGGSSDAATLLMAASRAWGLHWPQSKLAAIGARIGSDIPWFFAGGPAVALGRGETIQSVHGIPSLWVVIVSPTVGLSTAAVYAHCTPEASRRGEAQALAASFAQGNLRQALARMHNALESPARQLCPEVVRLLAAMAHAGAVRPMLTGSGSACFAIARTVTEARGIASRLEAAGWPGVWSVRMCAGKF